MRTRPLTLLLVATLLALAGWALLKTSRPHPPGTVVSSSAPQALMGTVSKLVVITDRDQQEAAEDALRATEAELRRLESVLSTWIDSSPISRLNAASAGVALEIPSEIEEVLTLARHLYDSTAGAFDITARPLIELWRHAGARGILPTEAELAAARAESRWTQLHLTAGGVVKDLSSTRVDVDGIAKGYAIDRALELLRRSGAAGGLVEVGGDLRAFGRGPDDKAWTVAVRSPFAEGVWAELEVRDEAVCSSGDYARFVEIGGRRFSHIVDPRSGLPADEIRSVTVIGPDAVTADVWATALVILGDAGLDLLDSSSAIEAMVVSGRLEDHKITITPGFGRRLVQARFEPSIRGVGPN